MVNNVKVGFAMTYYSYKTGFKPDMRVRVIKQHKYKATNLIGKVGTVKSEYGPEVAVALDDLRNAYSGNGRYYFKPSELEIIGDCVNDMEEKVDMTNITNYLNAVKIKYVDNTSPSSYIYANFDPDVKVGDLCVISSAHHGIGLARIVEVIDDNGFETCREVVAKVCTDAYDCRVANRNKAAELKAKMQERAKQLQDIALYHMLSEKDPVMMELLTEYQGIRGL